MAKFKITINIEREINALDEDEAQYSFWQTIEESNETIETIVAENIKIKEIK